MGKGKLFLVTGASGGLGRALVEEAAIAGHLVVAAAKDTDKLSGLLARYPKSIFPFSLDLREKKQIHDVVRFCLQKFDRIDVLVNNAGCGLIGALEESSEDEIQEIFNVNFFGPIRLIQEVLPVMRAQKNGHIVNVSGVSAIGNYSGFSVYGAAKHAIEGLSEGLAAEVAHLGIKVTILQPSPMRTDFVARSLVSTENHIDDYVASSGRFEAFLKNMNGKQPCDPVRAARALLEVIESGNPPLRLPLGKYAYSKVRKRLESVSRELTKFEGLTLASDY